MPQVYEKALDRHNAVKSNINLAFLEIQGFAKCIAQNRCLDNKPKQERIDSLCYSLQHQIVTFNLTSGRMNQMEALADLRNVAGLLFLEIEHNTKIDPI